MAADIYHPKAYCFRISWNDCAGRQDQTWISADGKRMAEDGLNDGVPDLLALEVAYGGGGKAKKAMGQLGWKVN